MNQKPSLPIRLARFAGLLARRLSMRVKCARSLRCSSVSSASQQKSDVRVSYAHEAFPHAVRGVSHHFSGGAVKYLWLDQIFPHSGLSSELIYAVSSSHYEGLPWLQRYARKRGIAFIWNQNGAYFPSTYGLKRAQKGNAAMARFLHEADHVFYQSQFARDASDFFLGPRGKRCEILHNAVDTSYFRPLSKKRPGGLVLLLAGSHNEQYRLTLALETLRLLKNRIPRVRLVVAGRMSQEIQTRIMLLAKRLSLVDRLQLLGPYTQHEAPALFARAHILLHTQYNDVCPSVVIEAMACGLPIVYSKTGGTPELVGEEGGLGVVTELDWNTPQPPSPEALADVVCRVADRWTEYSNEARNRAVTRFDLQPWLQRHREVFEALRP